MPDDPLEQEAEEAIEVGTPEMAWAQVWQLPVLLLGVGLLAVGVYFALPKYVPTDYGKKLADAEVLVTKNRLAEAEQALMAIGEDDDFKPSVEEEVLGYYWQLQADLRYRQMDQHVWQGITTEAGRANLTLVTDYYAKARGLGRALPAEAQWRYAQALAALGDDAEALAVVDEMPASSKRRHELVRGLVERAVQTDPDPASEEVANLLERYEQEIAREQDAATRRAGRVWAMRLRAERLLRTTGGEEGVIRMLVDGGLIRLKHNGASDRELAPLYVVLGEAYTVAKKFANARQQLDLAMRHLPQGSDLRPRVIVGLADIELAESTPGYIERAFGLYNQAYRIDPEGASSLDAKIGEAHTEAYREGRFREAVEAFALAADRLVAEQAPAWEPRRQKLEHYLDVHIQREFERENYQQALELLEVADPLMQDGTNAALLHRFAETYQHLGDASRAEAELLAPDPNEPGEDPHLAARRIHNQDAARYYEQAARAFLREAALIESKTVEHGVALWAAAENFGRAQLWDDAVKVYQEFLATRGEDARREEAMFRLGQAFLAGGEYAAARDQLQGLIEATDTSQWAMQSYVPLSRALVALDEWDQAQDWLKHVVEDHRAIGPESGYYRDALIELGSLYYRRGSRDDVYYARAIEVLGEEGGAVERYATPTPEQEKRDPTLGPRLRYMLADCLRLSAYGLGRQAADAPNQADRLAMQAERIRRLQDAQILYHQVVTELNEFHPDALSRVERVYHRNAYFYMADCAYDRSDFANAILLYQDAATRWQDHPSSLVAWVQIVNAAAEMEDYDRARAAHRQALDVFSKLPEEVFDHPDSLMTRQRWDDWLRWSTELDLYPGGSATAEVPTAN